MSLESYYSIFEEEEELDVEVEIEIWLNNTCVSFMKSGHSCESYKCEHISDLKKVHESGYNFTRQDIIRSCKYGGNYLFFLFMFENSEFKDDKDFYEELFHIVLQNGWKDMALSMTKRILNECSMEQRIKYISSSITSGNPYLLEKVFDLFANKDIKGNRDTFNMFFGEIIEIDIVNNNTDTKLIRDVFFKIMRRNKMDLEIISVDKDDDNNPIIVSIIKHDPSLLSKFYTDNLDHYNGNIEKSYEMFRKIYIEFVNELKRINFDYGLPSFIHNLYSGKTSKKEIEDRDKKVRLIHLYMEKLNQNLVQKMQRRVHKILDKTSIKLPYEIKKIISSYVI